MFDLAIGIVQLIRIPIVLTSIVFSWIGFLLMGSHPKLLSFAPLFFILSAGYTLNDIIDIEIDKINAPYRPLPSIKITIPFALKLYFILLFTGLVLGFFQSIDIFIFLTVFSIWFYIYSVYLKKNWVLKNVTTSIFFSLCTLYILFVSREYSGNISLWCLFISSLIFTLGREILMDFRDIEGDSFYGVNSLFGMINFNLALTICIILIGVGELLLLNIFDFELLLSSLLTSITIVLISLIKLINHRWYILFVTELLKYTILISGLIFIVKQ